MKRSLILLIIIAAVDLTWGQTQLSFNTSAKYQPTNWEQMAGTTNHSLRDYWNYWPALQADLGFRKSFKRSSWFAEAALSYRHVRQERYFHMSEIHPFYGFVYETSFDEGDKMFSDQMNYAGIRLGGGYRINSRSKKHALLLPLGLQLHVPLFSRFISYWGGDESTRLTYRDEDFDKGIYYGLYFKPAYEFTLAKKRSSPWRFSVYAEADLLIHHHSAVNPKVLWGGGLGVSYRLKP